MTSSDLGKDSFSDDSKDHLRGGVLCYIRDISFGSDGKVPELYRPITWKEAHAVLVRLRPGSAADTEGFVAGYLPD